MKEGKIFVTNINKIILNFIADILKWIKSSDVMYL